MPDPPSFESSAAAMASSDGDSDGSHGFDYSKPATLFSSLPASIQPSSFPAAEDVRREAFERSTHILLHWNTLQKILERHEETLRRRWMKKSKAQRKATLLTAWPDMCSTHRPDYQAFQKGPSQHQLGGSKSKAAYMWPHINSEDLVQGKRLLLFINSRGRHPPSMFAHADFRAMNLGHVSGEITFPFLNMYTMFLDGQTVETYGKLDAWEDNDEAFDLMYSGHGFQPGHGLRVLEIQQRILEFLVKCCQAILHDLDQNSFAGDATPIQPEPPAITGDPAEWSTMASIAGEAPYRVPAHVDFGRLKAVIAAKRSAAEDHVWALREDPGYFADVLGDWREHRQEVLLDTNGMRHPMLSNINPEPLWERVIGNVIVESYGAVVIWGILYRELTNLEVLKEKYSAVISPQKQLPPEYMKELLSFRYMLDQASKGPILTLKTGVPPSPPLRSLFVREPQEPGTAMIKVRTKRGAGPDLMLQNFMTLWDDHRLFLCGLPDLMDEFERLIQSDPKQKERLSAWVARVLSDLGVIARARHEIDIYQPWAAVMDNEFVDYEKAIQEEFAKKFADLAEFHHHFQDHSLAKVGMPSDGRFHYPSDKRRTQQATKHMRNSEQNLDLFWRTVDKQYRKKTGKTLHQALRQFITAERQLERTQEWIEPTKEPKKKKESEDVEFYKALSELKVDPKENPPKDLPLPKAKVKTKGVDAGTSQPPPEPLRDQPVPPIPDTEPTILITKRALKVFATLFHTPSQADQPGEIPWTDFLHAMATTGFEPSKLYGSIWQFTPTRMDVEHSIQFHEPHPRGKIPFRTARRWGRRLSRAYGWHGGLFVAE